MVHEQLSEVIISLTSYPRRFSSCLATIASLLRQTLRPHQILLWLSNEEVSERSLPRPLLQLQKRGLDIRIASGNILAYKKLFYALQQFPEAVIVTADDDTIYPEWWLSILHHAHLETPNSIVCYRAKQIIRAGARRLVPYRKWPCVNATQPSSNVMPTGVSGVLYFPGALNKNVIDDKTFMELSPYSDDLWFKAMSLLEGVPCRCALAQSILFPRVPGSQREALHKINNFQGGFDRQAKRVFDKYDLYDLIDA